MGHHVPTVHLQVSFSLCLHLLLLFSSAVCHQKEAACDRFGALYCGYKLVLNLIPGGIINVFKL